ncbi:HEPN domain-containing protein [Dyadobacter sp. CY347]|uniref:HEPN domain-containing protein n=1 Tax=Dyadobacter sp. CY347 TaxID=2909336 RepID=UPI001F19FB57|nr:HEPN domain-containing protein [Dyadobacter sp. CY347]MCF2490756.1 hypothetical protein [Dyadobacter sp. CY347]
MSDIVMNFEFWGVVDSLLLETSETLTIDNQTNVFAPEVAVTLINDFHLKFFGEIAVSMIPKQPLLVISSELGNLVPNFNPSEAYKSMAFLKDFTHDLTTALWFIKDNGVCVRQSFFMPEDIEQTGVAYYQGLTNAEGFRKPTKFTIEEFSESAVIMEKFKQVCPPPNAAENLHDKMGTRDEFLQRGLDSNHLLPYNFPRLTRALFMLDQARRTPAPVVKITFYMSAFECLFSDGDTEAITYKLGQRVAFLLATDKQERLNIRNSVKEGYKVRSSYIHGSELSGQLKNHDKLISISVEIDDLLRKTFLKVISEYGEQFMLSNNAFKKWLEEELIYGSNQSSRVTT